jgi:hypothetical protein
VDAAQSLLRSSTTAAASANEALRFAAALAGSCSQALGAIVAEVILHGSLTLDEYLLNSGGLTTNWPQALEASRSQSSHLLTSAPISCRASPSEMVRLGGSPFRRA